MTVNVSERQLLESDLAAEVAGLLRGLDLDASALGIEDVPERIVFQLKLLQILAALPFLTGRTAPSAVGVICSHCWSQTNSNGDRADWVCRAASRFPAQFSTFSRLTTASQSVSSWAARGWSFL